MSLSVPSRAKGGASKQILRRWFDHGKSQGYDYMIVVCDTSNMEDYPVYAYERDYFLVESETRHESVSNRIMEIYDLWADPINQLNAWRVYNKPEP